MPQRSKHALLDQLIVANKGWTGGEFDFVTCAPHTCTSWTGIYADLGNGATVEQPYFWLRVLYKAADARLVTTSAKGVFKLARVKQGILQFNAVRPFGLLPALVADAVIAAQSLDVPEYRTFLALMGTEAPLTQPKLVWDWSDAEGNVYAY